MPFARYWYNSSHRVWHVYEMLSCTTTARTAVLRVQYVRTAVVLCSVYDVKLIMLVYICTAVLGAAVPGISCLVHQNSSSKLKIQAVEFFCFTPSRMKISKKKKLLPQVQQQFITTCERRGDLIAGEDTTRYRAVGIGTEVWQHRCR